MKENHPLNYKNIVGLDLSLTSPGFSVYNVDTKEVNSGTWNPDKRKGFERIDWILDQVKLLTSKPDTFLVIEGYSFASKGAAVISLGELGGIIRHYLWKSNINYKEMPPTTAKKFLCGSGSAQKSIIIKEVYKKYSIDCTDDNQADAVNLMYLGLAIQNQFPFSITKIQQEILDKFK